MNEVFGIPYLKKGIHIKKKNRGSFTKYCKGKVTQSCIDKAKRSGNSKLVKKAVFAENSRKWKHQFGGNLSTKEQALQKLRQKYQNPYGGGKHGGGGAGTKFSYTPEQQFELKKDTLWVPIQQSYNEAFTNARKKGLKTFMFNGELKNTKLGNDPKAQEAGANRFQTIGVIPIERTKEVKKNEEGAKIHKPFGHKAITDNGWQSTKQLKNLRNVYGL